MGIIGRSYLVGAPALLFPSWSAPWDSLGRALALSLLLLLLLLRHLPVSNPRMLSLIPFSSFPSFFAQLLFFPLWASLILPPFFFISFLLSLTRLIFFSCFPFSGVAPARRPKYISSVIRGRSAGGFIISFLSAGNHLNRHPDRRGPETETILTIIGPLWLVIACSELTPIGSSLATEPVPSCYMINRQASALCSSVARGCLPSRQ
ncbi:uncharacterized protein BO80DRAFT_61998 [Aspergillus ibericus CBS 121593]|uniref:Uncharacterized protein n=1 Tax=Aspergillus ibericus CBS 121593 TaxID=1448316 RepID=A0A395H3V3_9EURO|nr:hypothetical protein BO80DRAFT_61998 [Aspergillus ibericus CBS 121593]RAL01538.1 hypothetical protein BO80DRAFT_61998 [Aspergillus ibericus CBS 121593]